MMNPPPAAAPLLDPFSPEALAGAPPPRRFFRVGKLPPDAYLKGAVDREPGDPADTLREVFCVGRLARECPRADYRLAADFFFGGADWPAPVRLAVLLHCPPALWLERRLAAIAARLPRINPSEET